MPLEPGQKLSHYRPLPKIGEGMNQPVADADERAAGDLRGVPREVPEEALVNEEVAGEPVSRVGKVRRVPEEQEPGQRDQQRDAHDVRPPESGIGSRSSRRQDTETTR